MKDKGKNNDTLINEEIVLIANGDMPCPKCGIQHPGVTMLQNSHCMECTPEESDPVRL